MRERKSREASSHASGVVSASAFLVGHHPASRLRLSRHFLIARLPLLIDQEGHVRVLPDVFRYLGQLLVRRGVVTGLPFDHILRGTCTPIISRVFTSACLTASTTDK